MGEAALKSHMKGSKHIASSERGKNPTLKITDFTRADKPDETRRVRQVQPVSVEDIVC